MSREDTPAFVDQHRIGEAEGPDAVDDLADLFLRMGSGVLSPGLQLGRRDHLEVGGVAHSASSNKSEHKVIIPRFGLAKQTR